MKKTTSAPRSFRDLEVYQLALKLIEAASALVPKIRSRDPHMATQLTRALPSITLNTAEGMRRVGRDRQHLLTVAMGSDAEVQAIMDTSAAMGYISETEAAAVDALADRVGAMLYRLWQRAR